MRQASSASGLKVQPPCRRENGPSFRPLAEDACRIDLELDYEVGSGLIARVLNPVFGHIANTLVDAFVKEAERRYGPGFGAS